MTHNVHETYTFPVSVLVLTRNGYFESALKLVKNDYNFNYKPYQAVRHGANGGTMKATVRKFNIYYIWIIRRYVLSVKGTTAVIEDIR